MPEEFTGLPNMEGSASSTFAPKNDPASKTTQLQKAREKRAKIDKKNKQAQEIYAKALSDIDSFTGTPNMEGSASNTWADKEKQYKAEEDKAKAEAMPDSFSGITPFQDTRDIGKVNANPASKTSKEETGNIVRVKPKEYGSVTANDPKFKEVYGDVDKARQQTNAQTTQLQRAESENSKFVNSNNKPANATGNLVENSNKGVANAKPGDWIISSKGPVVLTAEHINWAQKKLGIGKYAKVSKAQQAVQSKPTAQPEAQPAPQPNNRGFNNWLQSEQRLFQDIVGQIRSGANMDDASAQKLAIDLLKRMYAQGSGASVSSLRSLQNTVPGLSDISGDMRSDGSVARSIRRAWRQGANGMYSPN